MASVGYAADRITPAASASRNLVADAPPARDGHHRTVTNQAPVTVLCSDKHADGHVDSSGVTHGGHQGGFHVLWSDGSVSFIVETDPMIGEDKLPRGLAR